MPKHCVAVNCYNNNLKKDVKVSFHIFPVDPDRRQRWINAVSRKNKVNGSDWCPAKHSVVCGDHFITGMYCGIVPLPCFIFNFMNNNNNNDNNKA